MLRIDDATYDALMALIDAVDDAITILMDYDTYDADEVPRADIAEALADALAPLLQANV